MKEKLSGLLKNRKNILLYIGVVVIAALILFLGNHFATGGRHVFGSSGDTEVYPARIEILLATKERPYTVDGLQFADAEIFFEAVFTGGPRKGERIMARQVMEATRAVSIKAVEEGNRVMLVLVPYQDEGPVWIMQEYDRTLPLLILVGAFFLLLFLFGGKKGFGTILSLVFTCLCIFYLFVPSILAGRDIYAATLLCCLFIIVVTLCLVNGFNSKSLSAGLGCVGGLAVSGILFFVMDRFLQLTGLIDEDSAFLTMIEIPIDLKAIIFSSILIGVLGGVLDVGVSIASSLSEINREKGEDSLSFGDLMRSGMNIGRDILCTMTNTLILVYIGSALSVTLLLVVYSNSFLELINRESIVIEVLQALLGSIGLLFTIPLTTLFYALSVTRKKKDKGPGKQKKTAPPTLEEAMAAGSAPSKKKRRRSAQ
ncbi:MAG: YibE/F family protein [Oscillospiraceae bacterium]